MGETDQEREALKRQYPNSAKWAEKVNKMSDAQVAAIYIRLRSEGKLRK